MAQLLRRPAPLRVIRGDLRERMDQSAKSIACFGSGIHQDHDLLFHHVAPPGTVRLHSVSQVTASKVTGLMQY